MGKRHGVPAGSDIGLNVSVWPYKYGCLLIFEIGEDFERC
jgi:hypothetical protein